MRKFYQKTALATGMICLLGGNFAFAGAATDMETVKRQVQELIYQNQQLTRRIAELENGHAVLSGASSGTGNDTRISDKARADSRSVIGEEIAKQLA